MNPAALKTNLGDLAKGGTLIVDADAFTDRNLKKAGYDANPLRDGSLDAYQVHAVPLTSMTVAALKDLEGVTAREAERSKNMFALGLMSWLYGRPTETTIAFLEAKFAKRPEIVAANVKAFKTGYAFGETSESFAVQYVVKPARLEPGVYRQITGNQALSFGLIAASVQSGLPLFLGAYPITPASGILEELARYKHFGVRTFQAEDEIAAAGAALGASFGGSLGVCTSSGPGIVLKMETIGLAVTFELPLLIINVQRAGPSTGMPTKPEQADLLLTMFGRNAESPVPVLAASTPGGCFHAAIEAARIALKYRTPDVTGNGSYDPDNHDAMVRLRAQRVAGIASDVPELSVDDEPGAELLVLGWGGTYGPITAAVKRVRSAGGKVAQAHLQCLNPLPRNTGAVLRRYDRVLIPEMNLGQLLKLIRAEFLVDAIGYNRVRGLPFRSAELAEAIEVMA